MQENNTALYVGKKDMHRADIIARVHKAKTSLRKLSIDNGLSSSTINNALDRSYPKAELIIANAINLTPQQIWPTRYCNESGT